MEVNYGLLEVKFVEGKKKKVNEYDTIYEIKFLAGTSTYDTELENINVSIPHDFYLVWNPSVVDDVNKANVGYSSYIVAEENGEEEVDNWCTNQIVDEATIGDRVRLLQTILYQMSIEKGNMFGNLYDYLYDIHNDFIYTGIYKDCDYELYLTNRLTDMIDNW